MRWSWQGKLNKMMVSASRFLKWRESIPAIRAEYRALHAEFQFKRCTAKIDPLRAMIEDIQKVRKVREKRSIRDTRDS